VERSAQAIAACIALTAHAVAILSGIVAHNPADVVLRRALLVLGVAYVLGSILGSICEHVIAERLREYTARRPVPDLHDLERVIAQQHEEQRAA